MPHPVSFQINWNTIIHLNADGGHRVSDAVAAIAQQVVDHPSAAQDLLEQRHHDHPREEMREVHDVLDEPSHPNAHDAVEHERQAERPGSTAPLLEIVITSVL